MKREFSVIVVLGLLVGVALPVTAQETEPSDEVEEVAASESEGRVFEDEIVITAGRRETSTSDVAAPITVITSEDIEMLQPEKMADLFKMIPGVEIQGSGPFRGIPVIRGLSSNRVLILIDGQRLNNARESTNFAGIQPALVNLSEVERIEVLRGPASVQYGSDAIGGVVNIITRQPNLAEQTFKVYGNVAYQYGTTSDSSHGQAVVNGAGKGVSFHLGASIQDFGNYTAADGAYEDPRYEEYVLPDDVVPNSGMQQTDIDASFSLVTGRRGVFKIIAEMVRTEDVGFPGFDPATSGIDINFPVFDRNKYAASWESGPMGFLDDLTVTGWYQYIDKESVRNFNFPPYFFSDSYTRSEIESFGFNAQGVSTAGINHLTYGLDFYEDKLHDTASSESTGTPPNDNVAVPDSTQRALGLYIGDQITATSRLTLNLGLRGDTFSFVSQDDPRYLGEPFDVTDSALSGNLGVIYDLTEHVNLTGVIARGFRTPNLQERSFIGLASTGDTWIVQNPNLNAESSWNYEAGFKVRYDRYSGGLNFFYNDLTNFINLVFLQPGEPGYDDCVQGLDCAQFQNIEKASIQGIEANLEVIFAKWWTAFGTYAYLEGENKTRDEPLSAIPPWKIIAGLRYQRSAWWAEGNIRYVGSQTRLPADDPRFETGTEAFTVVDLRGGYEFGFGLGILVSLENIFDELYNEPLNNRPEPGLNLRATVKYQF